MTNFLLIHGSCHGAWCWDDLIPHLIAAGHTASAIDLPSHGDDQTPAALVTLDMYARKILARLDGPTVLVGHSMAGYPITVAADISSLRITKLVYLCAYVPQPGKSLADMRRMAPSQPLLEAVIRNPDGKTFSIDPAQATEKFYHDVAPDRAAWAVRQLGPQPILPQETLYAPTRVNTVPRHYIRCMDDHTIPPAFQVTMTSDWPASDLTEMPTSHSPFLSDPATLAAHLIRIAES